MLPTDLGDFVSNLEGSGLIRAEEKHAKIRSSTRM
jgi:hypothetical protein